MNTLTLNKVLLNARPLNMRKRIVKDKDFYYKVLDREFSFSITAGGKRIKSSTATIKRLKGNSVVWNQKSPKQYVNQDDVLYNIDIIPQNHKFALIRSKAFGHCYYMPSVDVYDYVLTDGEYAKIFVQSHVADAEYSRIYSSAENGYIQLIDLTQMFGAGNEPTTIEEYEARKPIVEDEYAYNEGEVIHMTAEGIKSVGDNAWDGLREMGDISGTTGEEFDSSSVWRAEGYIRILPNAEYCVEYTSRAFLRARFYDYQKKFIGIVSADNTDIYTNDTFTAPNNAYFIRFAPNLSAIPYDSELCVRLVHSGWKQDTDAGYQPYWEDRLMFDQRIKDEFPDGMQKWDMVYNKNGKGYIVKGTGAVDMGTLNWYLSNQESRFNVLLVTMSINEIDDNHPANLLCAKYATISYNKVYERNIGISATTSDGISVLSAYDSAYTDAASFKAAMAGVPLYYQLAEPTIIEYDEPFNLDYRVADFGTEQAIAEQPSAPISAEIGYHILKNNLELTLNS